MAAERSTAFSGVHCARILAALKLYGPSTAAELQNYTGLTVVQSNGADLTRKGYRVWEAV